MQYLVVGGHAVGFHARPRTTKDLDIWIGESRENRLRAVDALRAFQAPVAICHYLERAGPDDIVWFRKTPNRVDILQGLPGLEFEKAFSRTAHARADELIANKRAVGRPHDLREVRALERSRGHGR